MNDTRGFHPKVDLWERIVLLIVCLVLGYLSLLCFLYSSECIIKDPSRTIFVEACQIMKWFGVLFSAAVLGVGSAMSLGIAILSDGSTPDQT